MEKIKNFELRDTAAARRFVAEGLWFQRAVKPNKAVAPASKTAHHVTTPDSRRCAADRPPFSREPMKNGISAA